MTHVLMLMVKQIEKYEWCWFVLWCFFGYLWIHTIMF